MIVDGKGLPLAVHVTAGQVHEVTQVKQVLSMVKIKGSRGRPKTRPRALAGDKGYSAAWLRDWLRSRGIRPVIPHKSNERQTRNFDQPTYRKRAVVEQCVEWLKEKVSWLFETAGVPLLPFEYEQTSLSDLRPYLLAYYEAANDEYDEYVVIVSPSSGPKQFCRAGYQLVCTLEIGNAADFPTNVILRPDREPLGAMIKRKPTPTVGQSQRISPAQEDAWLEAAFEDRVSGQGDVEFDLA